MSHDIQNVIVQLRPYSKPKLAQLALSTPKVDSCIINSYYEINMGLSENRVPLNPMVNDHYPY